MDKPQTRKSKRHTAQLPFNQNSQPMKSKKYKHPWKNPQTLLNKMLWMPNSTNSSQHWPTPHTPDETHLKTDQEGTHQPTKTPDPTQKNPNHLLTGPDQPKDEVPSLAEPRLQADQLTHAADLLHAQH